MPHRLLPPALALVIFIAALSAAPVAFAQDRPDFSGTWTASPDPAAVSATGKPLPPVWGEQVTIDQKAQNLTLWRTYVAGPATITYALDGTETTSRMPGRLCEPDTGATWTASWEGPALTLAMISAIPPNGKPIKTDVRTTLQLESPDTLASTSSGAWPGRPHRASRRPPTNARQEPRRRRLSRHRARRRRSRTSPGFPACGLAARA